MCKKKMLTNFHLAVKIDLVEVVYYFKHVFHLLCNKSVAPEDELLYCSLISYIVV